MLTDRVNAELLEAAGPQLRVVANYAVGLDNVDVAERKRRGITVSNTPDALTDATAEMTIALMLALTRRVAEGDRFLRRGAPWQWAPTFMLGRGLRGLTLGSSGTAASARQSGGSRRPTECTSSTRRPWTSCSPPPTSSRCISRSRTRRAI